MDTIDYLLPLGIIFSEFQDTLRIPELTFCPFMSSTTSMFTSLTLVLSAVPKNIH